MLLTIFFFFFVNCLIVFKEEIIFGGSLFCHFHSSVLAWRIPGTGEPGGLPSLPEQPLGQGSALPRLGAELELRRSGSSLGPSQ